MRFEWDADKDKTNIEKHGLSFDDAEIVFSGPCLTFEDDRADYGEKRFVTLGSLAGRVVVIVHTPRPPAERIISMRKANQREREIYQQRLGEA